MPAHRSDAEVSADMLEWVKSVNGKRFMCLCRYVGGMDDIFQHAKVLAVHSLVYTVDLSLLRILHRDSAVERSW